jgi:hypothetical protein
VKVTFGSTDVQHEVALAESPLLVSARPLLTQMVGALQEASDPLDYYRLQWQLRQQLFAAQVVTKDTGVEILQLKRQLSEAVSTSDFSRSEISRLQGLVSRYKLAERSCKALMHALRVVADGMAWKTLGYDRAGIAVLGTGRRVGRLTDARGLDAELREIAEHWWLRGSFAIHNDLTNCLTTGDLTLPFEGDSHVCLQEVKAGSSRRPAQTAAAQRRVAFLQTGSGDNPMDCGPARLDRYPVSYRTHLATLRLLLARARSGGYAHARLSPAVVVVAVDPRSSGGDPGIDVYAERVLRQLGWSDHGDRLVRGLTMARRMSDRRYSFAYLAPWSIFPLPAANVADLLLGPLEYLTVINAGVLESEFAQRGIRAAVVSDSPEIDSVFLRAQHGTSEVLLPALVREQVLTELMTTDCLIAAVATMLTSIGAGSLHGPTLVGFADEDQVWA